MAIYTDGTKDAKEGNTRYASVIPDLNIIIKKETSDRLCCMYSRITCKWNYSGKDMQNQLK